jgi:IclR family transcriptional regulator, KDG regulon repressor
MVQVLIKAFDILELVAQRKGQPISLTEISEELQINQATAANIINTIVSKDYLEHIGKKKGYRLGSASYRLTNAVAYEQELINAAKDPMERLTAKLNETCILGILQNQKRFIIHVVNSNQDIQVQIRSERNVYETASGRLLLAYITEKELERFLQTNGLPSEDLWLEATTYEGLKEALRNIREVGLARTHRLMAHLKGFAVPIFNNNKVIAGLSVFVPEYRCSEGQEEKIVSSMMEASKAISELLP